jgi:outer membrane protein OmpA-like peptidoglycan-associated protein
LYHGNNDNQKEPAVIKSGPRIILWAAAAILCAAVAVADQVTEHPLIRPFPGAVLHERTSVYKNFDAYDFEVKNPRTGRAEKQTVTGEFRRLLYYLKTEDGRRNTAVSRVEYFENFKAAALEQGGEIQWEDSRGLVFTLPREDGGITWCRVEVSTGAGSTTLFIIDEAPLEKTLEFGPVQMKAALDEHGRIALYGILFDYDKATLQPSSGRQLQEVLTLLVDNPDLTLEIQGHTDSDGSPDYNLQLSGRRAESVLQYLVLFGIDPARLEARGYGASAPVAPNDTDENKARNRRVELVQKDR